MFEPSISIQHGLQPIERMSSGDLTDEQMAHIRNSLHRLSRLSDAGVCDDAHSDYLIVGTSDAEMTKGNTTPHPLTATSTTSMPSCPPQRSSCSSTLRSHSSTTRAQRPPREMSLVSQSVSTSEYAVDIPTIVPQTAPHDSSIAVLSRTASYNESVAHRLKHQGVRPNNR